MWRAAFVWTGFDYRGEPTPNEWPSVSSVFGIMDLNGFPKNAYYIHQVQWIKDRPLIHIAPHWNWSRQRGQGDSRDGDGQRGARSSCC